MDRFAHWPTAKAHELIAPLALISALAFVPACQDDSIVIPTSDTGIVGESGATATSDSDALAPADTKVAETAAPAPDAAVVSDSTTQQPAVEAAVALDASDAADTADATDAAADLAVELDAGQDVLADVVATSSTSICQYADGTTIPYDHVRGIVEEHAFNLSMSCELGEYIAPLVNADPVDLSEVIKFDGLLTSWLRQYIFECPGETDLVGSDFALFPPTDPKKVSQADFDAVVELYMLSLERQDGTPAALSTEQKVEVRRRLNVFAKTAVKNESTEFTHRLVSPECEVPDSDAGTD